MKNKNCNLSQTTGSKSSSLFRTVCGIALVGFVFYWLCVSIGTAINPGKPSENDNSIYSNVAPTGYYKKEAVHEELVKLADRERKFQRVRDAFAMAVNYHQPKKATKLLAFLLQVPEHEAADMAQSCCDEVLRLRRLSYGATRRRDYDSAARYDKQVDKIILQLSGP